MVKSFNLDRALFSAENYFFRELSIHTGVWQKTSCAQDPGQPGLLPAVSWGRTNTFPMANPGTKEYLSWILLGDIFMSGFFSPYYNLFCFFQTISRDANTTSGCVLPPSTAFSTSPHPLLPAHPGMSDLLSVQLGSTAPLHGLSCF